jgi:hypothetical protein
MGRIQSVGRGVMTHKVLAHKLLAYKVLAQVLAYARGQVGADAVDETVVAIPGLWQFI